MVAATAVGGLLVQAVDVTLPTTTSGWTTTAAVMGTVAAATTATWVAWVLVRTWWPTGHGGDRDEDQHWGPPLLATATVTSMLGLVAGIAGMVALDAVPSLADALTHSDSLVLAARVVVLALAWLLVRQFDALAPHEFALAITASAVLAGATVAVGGARLQVGGWPLDLLLAMAAMVIGGIAAAMLWRNRPDLRPLAWAVAVPVALAGLPAWLLVAPPAATPVAAVVVETSGGTLDVSVVPARPGSAALHLYAFGLDEQPVSVDGGTIFVVDGSGPTSFFRAGPNHLIAYGVELPDTPGWQVSISTTGDLDTTATTSLPRP